MKKKYAIITVVLCAVVLLEAALLSGYWEKTSRDDTLKVGFVYSEDESTPFTANFIRAQRELEEVYAGKVETITRSNVLSREAEDPMRELIRAGCKILFINMDTDLPLTLAP